MKYIAFDIPGEPTTLVAANPREIAQGETEEDFLNRIAAIVVPIGISYELVEPATLPSGLSAAWRIVSGQVVVHMPTAKTDFLKRVRATRDRLLDETDKDAVRGIERGTDISSLKAYRQSLRDWPTLVASGLAAATTVEEIEALPWPTKP